MKSLLAKALSTEPRLTWEVTKEGLKGTYCGSAPNKPGKAIVVSGTIKNPEVLTPKEFTEEINKLSHALRDRVHQFKKV